MTRGAGGESGGVERETESRSPRNIAPGCVRKPEPLFLLIAPGEIPAFQSYTHAIFHSRLCAAAAAAILSASGDWRVWLGEF